MHELTKSDFLLDQIDRFQSEAMQSMRMEADRLSKLSDYIEKSVQEEGFDDEHREDAWRIVRYGHEIIETECARLALLLDPDQLKVHAALSLLVQQNPSDYEFYTNRPDLWSRSVKAPFSSIGLSDDIKISWSGAGDEGDWIVYRESKVNYIDSKEGRSPLLRLALNKIVYSADTWVRDTERQTIQEVIDRG